MIFVKTMLDKYVQHVFDITFNLFSLLSCYECDGSNPWLKLVVRRVSSYCACFGTRSVGYGKSSAPRTATGCRAIAFVC